ncbi:hypothetical protein ACHAXT_004156 [Thalassiosira profunda]
MGSPIATFVTLPSFIALVVLLIWTSIHLLGDNDRQNQNNGQNGGEGQGEGGWWDGELRPEELESIKVILNLAVLTIATATLCTPISKSGSGFHERFNEGVLAAALGMVGNILFVSFWYFVSIGGDERREEENNNNQYGGGGYYYNYWMDDRERLAYHEKVVSYTSLALAFCFYLAALFIHGGAQAVPEDGRLSLRRPDLIDQSSAHRHVVGMFGSLRYFWMGLWLVTTIVFAGLFVGSCILSGGEGADRRREEGKIINLILITLLVILIAVILMMWGSEVFREQSTGSLGVGLLYGGTKYFAGLLFLLCVLTADPSNDERQREENGWVSTVAPFACLFLSLAHLVFSHQLRKCQVAMIEADMEQPVSIIEPKEGMVPGATGDFVRVEEPVVQAVV